MNKKRVMIGMSGGVDSTVAASILQEEGFHVEGFYMKNGFLEKSEEAARSAAAKLDIPLHVTDLAVPFDKKIARYFVSEYLSGRTPSPCVLCNKTIKFFHLMELADRFGCDTIATGHYARIENLGGTHGCRIRKGVDTKKDQSYFLSRLGQKEISRIIFPLGSHTKEMVKEMASRMGFGALAKQESQEICFIADDYRTFLERQAHTPLPRPGNIITSQGRIVGRHGGIHTLTIGQRRGLNIASSRPYYVIDILRETDEIVVGRDEDQLSHGLIAEDISWVSPDYLPPMTMKARVQIRYRHGGVDATIDGYTSDRGGNAARVLFEKPQKAVAPGQAAVFYQGDIVIGGGWIERGIRGD